MALICWSVVEAVLRQDMAPRPLLLLAALAVVAPLPWRRAQPLVAVTVAFGSLTVVDIVRILTGSQGALPSSVVAALVLAYALFRWGSGREAAGGLGVILVWLAITHVADPISLAETVAGVCVLPVRGSARRRDPLSRGDPHPRHRPSQVPKARTARPRAPRHRRPLRLGHRHPGPSRPGHRGLPPRACHRAAATIEDTATRTLTELRAIVGVLRASQDTEFAPQPGVAEVEQFANGVQTHPLIEVTFSGELDDLSPAVGAAI